MSTDDLATWSATAPNAEGLPYVIRVRGWALWLSIAFYVLIAIACFAAAVWFWRSPTMSAEARVGLAAGFVLCGALLLAPIRYLLLPSFVLHADRVEKTKVNGVQVLRRDAVKGLELVGDGDNGEVLQLTPLLGRGKPMRLHRFALKDPVFQAWLDGVRDLTAEAYAASERAVLSDAKFGATPDERARRLARVQQIANAANLIAVGVFFWALVHPHPYRWAIGAAALMPWIGLAIFKLSNGLVVWTTDRTNARPGVMGPIYCGSAALALRAFLDIDLIDLWPMVAGAAAVAVLAAAVIVGGESPQSERNVRIGMGAVVIGLYVFGAATQLDAILDQSSAQVFPLVVAGKHSTSGRNASYDLDVGPWGGRPAGSLSVASSLYDEVAVGSPVCVYRYAGALKARWFSVDHCAGWKPPATPPTHVGAPRQRG